MKIKPAKRGALADDLERAKSSGAPFAKLSIRTWLTAAEMVARVTGMLERQVQRAVGAQRKVVRLRDSVVAGLSEPLAKDRMAQVRAATRSGVQMAYLGSWVVALLVWLVVSAVTVNDPAFVSAVVRRGFLVPTDVGLLDVGRPGVLVSLTLPLAISAALLAAALGAGRLLGSVVFRPTRSAEQRQGLGFAEADGQLNPVRRIVLAGVLVAVLVYFMVKLNALAAANFSSVTTVFGTGGAVNPQIISVVTYLPVIVLALELFASAPMLVHARRVSLWRLAFRLREWTSLRRERRLVTKAERRYGVAYTSALRTQDLLDQVGARQDYEVTDAEVQTGTDLTSNPDDHVSEGHQGSVRAIRPATEATSTGAWVGRDRPIDRLTAMPRTRFGLAAEVVSHRVAASFQTLAELPEPDHRLALHGEWDRFRNDPEHYTGRLENGFVPAGRDHDDHLERGPEGEGPTDGAGEPQRPEQPADDLPGDSDTPTTNAA